MPKSLDESHLLSSATAPITGASRSSSGHVSAEGQTPGQKPGHVTRAVTGGAESRRLGSKANEATWKTIINQMPPHHTYIEPFLGWGAIMLHKLPAAHSICIDREEQKVKNFLLELRHGAPDDEGRNRQCRRCRLVDYRQDRRDDRTGKSGHKRRLRRGDITSNESHLHVVSRKRTLVSGQVSLAR